MVIIILPGKHVIKVFPEKRKTPKTLFTYWMVFQNKSYVDYALYAVDVILIFLTAIDKIYRY